MQMPLCQMSQIMTPPLSKLVVTSHHRHIQSCAGAGTRLRLSLWLIGTVRAEAETVISRAWVQSSNPAK